MHSLIPNYELVLAPGLRLVYSILFYGLTPAFFIRLLIRSIKAPAYRERWGERIAIYPNIRPLRPIIWIHAVSVGEVEAATSLINRFQRDFASYELLVTTTTPTGSARVRSLYGTKVRHVYLPYDLPVCIKKFFKFFKPTIAIIIETEIWPNLFYYAHQQGIPLVIANARLSPKSAHRYQYIGMLIKPTLACVSAIAAQTEKDRQRFLKIGAKKSKVLVSGNIKFDIDLPNAIGQESKQLKKTLFSDQAVLIAASTHEGEDEKILKAFAAIKSHQPELILVLVPRHPERFDAVARLCKKQGYCLTRRSSAEPVTRSTDIYLLDTLGELKSFYGVAEIAFVGGSLVATGGHNVIEPAMLKVPVIVGPHTFNFEEITELLIEAGAAIRITDTHDLARKVIALLNDTERRKQMGKNSTKFIRENRGALDRTMDIVVDLLNR